MLLCFIGIGLVIAIFIITLYLASGMFAPYQQEAIIDFAGTLPFISVDREASIGIFIDH